LYTFDYTRTVAATPQECFDVTSDPDRGAEWVSMASRVDAEGPPGVGRTLKSKAGIIGVNFTVESHVHIYDEPGAYGWRGDKPFHAAFEFAFHELQPGETRIDAKVDFDPGRFFKFGTGKLAASTFKHQFEGDLDRLVELIRGHAA
jgi:carbon monoxide dehydrogenase subunit G